MSDSHQDLGDVTQPHMAVHMSGNDDLYGSDSEEVIIKKIDSQKDMITSSDLQAVIDGWEERFEKLTEGMRTIERGQFEAIARHQCWASGEKVVHLVASLTGPAANLLIGMTVYRLSCRYDPPEREEAHRRSESTDEYAENLKNLAQHAYSNADQNMLDNLVVERFREGHNNIELKKHLCLYPSTGLQDLIGACVRFEAHVELGARAYKPNEGMYTVKGNEPV